MHLPIVKKRSWPYKNLKKRTSSRYHNINDPKTKKTQGEDSK